MWYFVTGFYLTQCLGDSTSCDVPRCVTPLRAEQCSTMWMDHSLLNHSPSTGMSLSPASNCRRSGNLTQVLSFSNRGSVSVEAEVI